MHRFLRRRGRSGLESELRTSRPQPPPDFVHSLAERVERSRPARGLAPKARRLAVAGALTATLLAGVAAFGGLGQAATAAKSAVESVEAVLTGSSSADPVTVDGLSSAGDQYLPGFAWGDPSHNHSGPPGLVEEGAEEGVLAPPRQVECRDGVATLELELVLDEQADLALSILKPNGKKLGGLVTTDEDGETEPTNTILHRVLVPRTLEIALEIPCDRLRSGELYRLHVEAVDPSGQATELEIPFLFLDEDV